MPTNEKGLVDLIQRTIAVAHPSAWQFKVVGNPYQMTGVPDLLICVNGLLVGLEVKFIHPGETEKHARGRTTAIQRATLARINNAGGIAGTVTSPQEALDIITRGLERRKEAS